jgi:hypothetical protein
MGTGIPRLPAYVRHQTLPVTLPQFPQRLLRSDTSIDLFSDHPMCLLSISILAQLVRKCYPQPINLSQSKVRFLK